MTPINRTHNGRLLFCRCCDCFQLEFGTFMRIFSRTDFAAFRRCIRKVDAETCEQMNGHLDYRRKIFIPFADKAYFCLTADELDELKVLLRLERQSVDGYDCRRQLAAAGAMVMPN